MKPFQQIVGYLTFALAIGSSAAVPAGRLAFVNDASASKDADDVCAIPFQVALMSAFNATSKLVHWSYACDYKGDVIRDDRMAALNESLSGAIAIWSDPKYGLFRSNIFFNCRDEKHRTAGIAHLKDCINESSAENPLWIIEAGEPDVIGDALQDSDAEKRKYVKVVTHHRHNDVGAKWKLHGNIAALPGMAEDFIVRIPDQNVELKKPEKNDDWMKSSTDPRIQFLWNRTRVSTTLGWAPAAGIVDPSDAGMVWFVLDGGPTGGGDETPSSEKIRERIVTWCATHPATEPTIQSPP